MLENIITYTVEILIDCNIRISQYGNMQLCKLFVSFCVVGFLIRKIMKASVKLDNNPRTCDIEVNDEITDILLSVDGHG